MPFRSSRRDAEDPGGGRRARRSSRSTAVGLALSAVVHILAIVVYAFSSAPGARHPAPARVPSPPPPAGVQVVRIVETESSTPENPTDPLELETPDEPSIVPDMPVFEGDRFELPGRYRPAAERLRVGPGDPRLWGALEPEVIAPTPDEVLELRLLAAIEAMTDSALAEAERAQRALDWTHTDDEGRRWGFSPGQIHLGDVTLPLPFGFGPPPDYTGERAEMAFRLSDIDRAARVLGPRRSWKERAEAMRERREELRRAEEAKADAERAAKPPVVKPDTTRSR